MNSIIYEDVARRILDNLKPKVGSLSETQDTQSMYTHIHNYMGLICIKGSVICMKCSHLFLIIQLWGTWEHRFYLNGTAETSLLAYGEEYYRVFRSTLNYERIYKISLKFLFL